MTQLFHPGGGLGGPPLGGVSPQVPLGAPGGQGPMQLPGYELSVEILVLFEHGFDIGVTERASAAGDTARGMPLAVIECARDVGDATRGMPLIPPAHAARALVASNTISVARSFGNLTNSPV